MNIKINIKLEFNRELLKGYEDFLCINDDYIVGNGILIDKSGKVLWNQIWKHSFANMYFHPQSNTIIMDRLAMIGPLTLSAGICAVDFNTGKYLWKYWYDYDIFEQIAFMNKKKSIKLENLNHFAFTDSSLFTENFIIEIKSGRYVINDKVNEKNQIVENNNYPKKIKIERVLIHKNNEAEMLTNTLFDFYFRDEVGFLYFVNENDGLIYFIKDNTIIDIIKFISPIKSILAYNFFGIGILLYIKINNTSYILIFSN